MEYYEQALAIHKQVGNPRGEGETLNNIGSAYNNLGEYPKALEYYEQALAIHKQVGDFRIEGVTLNNIGGVYDSLGQYSKALEYYEQALAIRKQVGDPQGESTSLNNIGGVYDSLGEYPKALEYYKKALAITKQIGNSQGEGTTLNNIGLVYQSLRQYPKALKYYEQALEIRKQVGDRPGEGVSLNNIGGVYKILEQHTKALDYYNEALAIRKQVGDRLGEGITLNNIGSYFLYKGNFTEAEKILRKGIQVWNSLRPDLKDQDKISIFDQQVTTYRSLQQALIAQNKNNDALEISEQSRARAFTELLASKISSPSITQPQITPPKISEIQQIAEVQNATLVEYSIINEVTPQGQKSNSKSLYIWVISPNGKINFRKVPLLATSLKELVKFTRQSIGVRNRSSIEIIPETEPDQQKQLQQLHKLLIEPISHLLPKDPNARVIFIPQDELFSVPFPALQDAKGKYLIEKHTILTAPAIQVLDLTKKQKVKVKQANLQRTVVVGNPTMPKVTVKIGEAPEQLKPLPAAQEEGITIAKLLKTKALIGKQATKTAILPQLSQARIIHLATHGLLDDFKGLGVPGAIALAPSGNGEINDGLLTANEILDLKLNAELVVLSACDTGRGRITSDSVIGLSRSLIMAGTPSVVVSLWSVPDAPTAELMSEFYRNWLDGKLDKAQALRQAMLTTMKKRRNPRNWAAFTLIGEVK